jgi:hypothetical protein
MLSSCLAIHPKFIIAVACTNCRNSVLLSARRISILT